MHDKLLRLYRRSLAKLLHTHHAIFDAWSAGTELPADAEEDAGAGGASAEDGTTAADGGAATGEAANGEAAEEIAARSA